MVNTLKPVILIEGKDDTAVNLNSASFTPYLHGVPIHGGAEKLSKLEALMVLVAAMRLIGSEYPVANWKSWCIMAEAAMGYPPKDSVKAALQKVLNLFSGCNTKQ